MFKYGITDKGDPAFERTVEERLCECNIIITKNISKVNDMLLRNKEKCILHATITGYGGTVLEPNVPTSEMSFKYMKNLIDGGFPPNQIILRVEPILQSSDGIKVSQNIIKECIKHGNIKNMRFSYLTLYPHVRCRFEESKVEYNYLLDGEVYSNSFENWLAKLNYFESVTTCDVNSNFPAPCNIKHELIVLDVLEKYKEYDKGKTCETPNPNDRTCKYPPNKTELIRKDKQERCWHQCLYCYMNSRFDSIQFWGDETNSTSIDLNCDKVQ